MMRLLKVLAGVRVFGLQGNSAHAERARSARASASFVALTAAIEAADLMQRESNDEGFRIAVISAPLGGSFFYSRNEVKARIGRYFPDVTPDDTVSASLHLDSRIRIFLKPIKQASQPRSWARDWGWREER
jgi:hypothetical protein